MDNPLLPKYPQPQKGPFQPDYVLHDYVPTGSLKWFDTTALKVRSPAMLTFGIVLTNLF